MLRNHFAYLFRASLKGFFSKNDAPTGSNIFSRKTPHGSQHFIKRQQKGAIRLVHPFSRDP